MVTVAVLGGTVKLVTTLDCQPLVAATVKFIADDPSLKVLVVTPERAKLPLTVIDTPLVSKAPLVRVKLVTEVILSCN